MHIISNGKQTLYEFISVAARVFPYVTAIHIREKQRSADEISDWITALIQSGVPARKIVVNSRVELAVELKTGGVHLSADFSNIGNQYPNLRIGRSVHNVNEAIRAQKDADYLFYGHIYRTSSKPGMAGRGLDTLREVIEKTTIPVIAIGGITPARVKEVLQAGASGIAVMSGVFEVDDALGAVLTYQSLLRGGLHQ